MARRKTDYRALQARRDAALARPELRQARPHTVALDAATIEKMKAAGRFTVVPPQRRR